MKKTLIILGCMSVGLFYAQNTPSLQKLDTNIRNRVGVNTEMPQASMDVKELLNGNSPLDIRIQGVSLPNFTTEQRNKFGEGQTESMKIGTLIYNTTEKCIEMYLGYYDGAHQWSCDLSGEGDKVDDVVKVNVEPSGFEGSFVQNVQLGNSPYRYVSFKITNNSLFPINNFDFSNAVTFTNGGDIKVVPNQNSSITIGINSSVVLKYRVEGTVKSGPLVAKFQSLGGLAAEQQINIDKLPARCEVRSCGSWTYYNESLEECQKKEGKVEYVRFTDDGNTVWSWSANYTCI